MLSLFQLDFALMEHAQWRSRRRAFLRMERPPRDDWCVSDSTMDTLMTILLQYLWIHRGSVVSQRARPIEEVINAVIRGRRYYGTLSCQELQSVVKRVIANFYQESPASRLVIHRNFLYEQENMGNLLAKIKSLRIWYNKLIHLREGDKFRIQNASLCDPRQDDGRRASIKSIYFDDGLKLLTDTGDIYFEKRFKNRYYFCCDSKQQSTTESNAVCFDNKDSI